MRRLRHGAIASDSIHADCTMKHGAYQRQWKRVLYEKQHYEDNYVDPTKFFDQLNLLNEGSERPTFKALFLNASVIAQEFAVISIFLTVYKYIVAADYGAFLWLTIVDILLLLTGCCLHYILEDGHMQWTYSTSQVALFGICLRIAAPILQTLTSSFSNDTLHALAITFSAIHLVLYDYAYVNNARSSINGTGTLSLNAAMFTAIILASRLHDIEVVVAFLLLAVIAFSLFPATARLIKRKSLNMHLALTIFEWAMATTMLYTLDKTLFVVFEILMVILWLLAPYVYHQMYIYKRALRGPWDIPHVE